ncbi:Calcium-dependent lipid-binding (CaLB domain) family protein [Zea mays]|uniref:Calcium-dependent lipid-binding (CaLB domain) family protein n=1 Tax=Zea mays TaxID=4577 RepID=A0A1D6Q6J2_MAIZE|nr:Calcium-dependent lipid-binding (CaLB domain) family protein [Zea mays]
METREGVLELLLVSAEGLKHAHHHPRRSKRHYVTIECGDKIATSKITQGRGKKIWWNEKFRFALSDAERRELAKVTLTIMEMDRVYVGEIISEGSEREFLQTKPAPYNVVLEDGTYKGVLKLGLKFISSVSLEQSSDCVRCPAPAPAPAPTRQTSAGHGLFFLLNSFALPSIPWRRLFSFASRWAWNHGQAPRERCGN